MCVRVSSAPPLDLWTFTRTPPLIPPPLEVATAQVRGEVDELERDLSGCLTVSAPTVQSTERAPVGRKDAKNGKKGGREDGSECVSVRHGFDFGTHSRPLSVRNNSPNYKTKKKKKKQYPLERSQMSTHSGQGTRNRNEPAPPKICPPASPDPSLRQSFRFSPFPPT